MQKAILKKKKKEKNQHNKTAKDETMKTKNLK